MKRKPWQEKKRNLKKFMRGNKREKEGKICKGRRKQDYCFWKALGNFRKKRR